ncbi:choice-of-anchor B family protein [Glaciecola sp. 1036]|uniref:choice-of-anchor B family protein n=1 Tax=Alteromonadaceae TaxID=72275 RepID=UPI003D022B71
MLRCIGQIICLLMFAISFASFGHAEKEKARFVAEDGKDQGRCNNRFRPCATIEYAVQQANKGDKILVSAGTYTIDSEQALLYLLSELQPVLGGFNKLDNFQIQQPDKSITTLVGVPQEYAQTLFEKGFTTIVDSKSLISKYPQKNMAIVKQALKPQAAAECIDGTASGYNCENVSLLSHVPLSELPTNSNSANDIWGHVDLNDMREYALIGLQNGVAVVDVTNPQAPVVIGSVAGQNTTWRDIKVHQYYSSDLGRWMAYAYVSADNVTEGLTILDLNSLPETISLVKRVTNDLQAHNIYISNQDYTTNTALSSQQAPLLHVAGSENRGGSWRSYSLENPRTPVSQYVLSNGSRNDYSHDLSSVNITDARKETHCQASQSDSCNLILDFNENELRLWDHSNPSQATELGRETYPDAAYVHSGWWSEDKNYVILHDELDERNFGLNTKVHIFDITQLNSPELVSTWTGPTRAIDHNGFTRGNKYYMSNYERGMTILDLSDPLAPEQIGFFDTFSSANNTSFNGAWGVYPYLPSGIILVSDIQGGLYVLQDDTLTTSAPSVRFTQKNYETIEGETLSVSVEKQGNDAMSVAYHVFYGSASEQDYQIEQGELQWITDDLEPKSIEIAITDDGIQETDEMFFIRLNNPQGGSIDIAASTAFVSIISDDTFPGQVVFESAEITVKETDGEVEIPVQRVGGDQGALLADYIIDFETSVQDDIAAVRGTLEWTDGDSQAKSVYIDIQNDTESESNESFLLTLVTSEPDTLGDQNQIRIVIRDDESNQPPQVNAGNDIQVNTRQTVQITASASDAESDVSILWQQITGDPVTLSNANSLSMTFTAPSQASTLSFEVTATDDFGVSATDSVSVTVIAASNTPQAPPQSSGGGSWQWTSIFYLLLVIFCRRLNSATAH